jgi:hypothetical protein
VYWNKNEDLELVWVNGVLLTEVDQPMRRDDKQYPLVWGGFEYIDEGRFSYYKSLVFKLAPEQAVVDEMYNMVLDGTYLALMPPAAVFGEEIIDSGVIAPGNVVTFENPETKMETFAPRSDLNAGYTAIQSAEASMAESSQGSQAAGIASRGEQTAFEVATLEQNARVQLGLFGKQQARMIGQWGKLRMGDIVQYLTIPEVKAISNGTVEQYQSFLLGGEMVSKGDKSKRIDFDLDAGSDVPVPEEEAIMEDLKLLEEAEKKNMTILKMNPKKFRNMKFSLRVDPDVLYQPTGALARAEKMGVYDRAVASPVVDLAAVTRDLLIEPVLPGQGDKYVKQPEPVPAGAPVPEGKGASGVGGGSQGATAGVPGAVDPNAIQPPKAPNVQQV